MTPVDREDASQEDSRPFERSLLDSARADELPRDVSGAWARFGASLASVSDVAAVAVPAGVRPGVNVRAGSGAAARGARLFAVKWLIVGAVVGSALTLLGTSRARQRRTGDVPRAAGVVVGAVAAPAVAALSMSAEVATSVSVPMDRQTPAMKGRSSLRWREARPSASTLGAQVALLDAARAALGAGAFAAALHATDRYEREFPAGELLPEAEVVAIEALTARGDLEARSERAARFLARYPTDPHAARVKALAER